MPHVGATLWPHVQVLPILPGQPLQEPFLTLLVARRKHPPSRHSPVPHCRVVIYTQLFTPPVAKSSTWAKCVFGLPQSQAHGRCLSYTAFYMHPSRGTKQFPPRLSYLHSGCICQWTPAVSLPASTSPLSIPPSCSLSHLLQRAMTPQPFRAAHEPGRAIIRATLCG